MLNDIVQRFLGNSKKSALDVWRQRTSCAYRLEVNLNAGLSLDILSQSRQGFAQGSSF